MQRFYFTIIDGYAAGVDADGVDVADLKTAQFEALRTLVEMAWEALNNGLVPPTTIEIREEPGKDPVRTVILPVQSGGVTVH